MTFDFRDIRGPLDSKQDTFSSLCSRLIMRLLPTAKPVDGSGGDEGIDTFVGTFNGSCAVYQHKYFPDRLGPAQRKQVKNSLAQALNHHDVQSWTLMLPNPA